MAEDAERGQTRYFPASRQAREACEFLLNLAQDVRRSVA